MRACAKPSSRHYSHRFRSSDRYWIASVMCSGPITSAPAMSAMVRAETLLLNAPGGGHASANHGRGIAAVAAGTWMRCLFAT